jgi:DNA-binding LacI/PurR family transcriptional regulator
LNPETSHLVKEERRKDILELADKMRYRPNPGARLIQRGVSSTIGVLIPSDEDVFFSEFYGRFMGGMLQAIKDTDWEVRINALKDGSGSVLDEFRRVGLGCSGLIYAGQPLTTKGMDQLSEYHSPLILMSSVIPPDYPIEKVGCHVLGIDNYGGAVTAAKYIAKQGHKRIGLIVGPDESRDFSERTKGYLDGLKQAGIIVSDDMVFQGSYDQESGRAGCEYFMGKESMPTALICASDNIAFGALDYAKDHGVSCPKDVSIIGFDDGPWAIACSPKLTTIRQPLGALTSRAVEVLMQAVGDPSADCRQRVNLSPVLNIRESTTYARKS